MKNNYHRKLALAFLLGWVLAFLSGGISAQERIWTNIGTPNFMTAKSADLALDASGSPWVVYVDQARVSVKKFDGFEWVAVGMPGFAAGEGKVSLGFDSSETPYVAYPDTTNDSRLAVMKFDGSEWIPVGPAALSQGAVNYSRLIFDIFDTPYVLYSDATGNGEVAVMEFDGANWVSLGMVAGVPAGGFSLAMNEVSGTLYMAHVGVEGKITVQEWDGADWLTLGTPNFSAGTTSNVSLALNSSGNLYVAYSDNASGRVSVMEFDGADWVLAGPAGFAEGGSYIPLASDASGSPYVVSTAGGLISVMQLAQPELFSTGELSSENELLPADELFPADELMPTEQLFSTDELLTGGSSSNTFDAAASFPGLSSSAYAAGYCRSTANNTPVYTSTALNTRGTSSPYKAYAATIYATDEIYVYAINATYAYVSYPASGGRRYGYIRTTDLTASNYNHRATASGTVTTYRRPGGAAYGYFAKGDTVIGVASVSGYIQVFYTAKSGSRAWKIGYVKEADYNKYVKSVVSTTIWQYPMSNYRVTLGWNATTNSPPAPGRTRHSAIDMTSSNTNILATASGQVMASGYNSSNGNFIVIKHVFNGNVVYSFYAHLNSRSVSAGNIVTRGQKIGVMGNTGRSFGAHLHFAMVSNVNSSGGYYGYVPAFSGNKVTYGGTTFYNPAYIISNGRLP